MNRPVEVTDEQIIEAGKSLLAAGKRVNGSSLREIIGSGAQNRLRTVWEEYVRSGKPEAAQGSNVEVPFEVEQRLEALITKNSEHLRVFASEIYAAAHNLTDRRIRDLSAELDKANERLSEELAAADDLIDRRDNDLQHQAQRIASLEEKLDALSRQLGEAQAESIVFKEQAERSREQVTGLEATISDLQMSLATAQVREKEAQRRAEDTEKNRTSLQISLDAVTDASNQFKTENARLGEEVKGLRNQLALQVELTNRANSELSNARGEIQRLTKRDD